MTETCVILWFRNDLRLADHPALTAAIASGKPVLPVFVLDDEAAGEWRMGAASRWWLHGSLTSLVTDLHKRGAPLILARGEAAEVLTRLAKKCGADAIYCTRAYEPWAARQEQRVKDAMAAEGVSFKRYAGALLREPEEARTKAGDPFRVYSPFWRALVALGEPRKPIAAPKKIAAPSQLPASDVLPRWGLLPTKPDWAGGMRSAWSPGEAAAQMRLDAFLGEALADYGEMRNRPDVAGTSRLSPHLHFGEISPNQCWHAARAVAASNPRAEKGLETFLKELAWREFSYHLLVHWPTLPSEPFRAEFAAFPWAENKQALAAWQRGRTGYPVVDAGMRELWSTGWMHNRVRMIVASFLIKDLLIHWRDGEAWFWDTLVDADLASNAASWQWVAGSGADAAPYFRIFNPISQGQKFDPDGAYVRRWVPELAALPDAFVHAPWEADAVTLAGAGVVLGKTYPQRIVDHAAARAAALAAFGQLKALA